MQLPRLFVVTLCTATAMFLILQTPMIQSKDWAPDNTGSSTALMRVAEGQDTFPGRFCQSIANTFELAHTLLMGDNASKLPVTLMRAQLKSALAFGLLLFAALVVRIGEPTRDQVKLGFKIIALICSFGSLYLVFTLPILKGYEDWPKQQHGQRANGHHLRMYLEDLFYPKTAYVLAGNLCVQLQSAAAVVLFGTSIMIILVAELMCMW